MDTNTFVQQEHQSYTFNVNLDRGNYKFIKPKIKSSKKRLFIKEEEEIEAVPEMTKAQWEKYYKKMGLQ